VATANFLINRTSTSANGGTTPFEKLTGQIPSVENLKVFGCRSFVLDTSPSRKKWAPRAHECVFLGYDSISRGFRNYNRQTGKIIVSKDVQFDEKHFSCLSTQTENSKPSSLPEWPSVGDASTNFVPEPVNRGPSLQALSSTGPEISQKTPEQLRLLNGEHNAAPIEFPITDFSVDITLSQDVSHNASLPLFTYQRRRLVSQNQELQKTDPSCQNESLPPTTRSGRTSKLPPKLRDFYLHVAEIPKNLSLPLSAEAALLHPG
jgi:hypothetical protein